MCLFLDCVQIGVLSSYLPSHGDLAAAATVLGFQMERTRFTYALSNGRNVLPVFLLSTLKIAMCSVARYLF
jgi:hypothetical protein